MMYKSRQFKPLFEACIFSFVETLKIIEVVTNIELFDEHLHEKLMKLLLHLNPDYIDPHYEMNTIWNLVQTYRQDIDELLSYAYTHTAVKTQNTEISEKVDNLQGFIFLFIINTFIASVFRTSKGL